jgi:hypothetical protein
MASNGNIMAVDELDRLWKAMDILFQDIIPAYD